MLEDATAVTSGTYERYFEKDGKRYHHIFDTATGYPVENSLASVTMVGEDSLMADSLATGVFAMGLAEGKRFVEANERIEAIFITKSRTIHISSGLRGSFELSNEEFALR
jgi:thiamine biosynthesis lipoprotein